MKRRLGQTARSSEGGFVIVAVLWILIALSALAAIFSIYLSNSARALGATDINVERDALVSASLELTAYRLLSADEKERPAQGSFHFRMDDADASVMFISEAARIDLNQAPKEMLAGLFEVLGAEHSAAGELADRVVGWRTKSKPSATNEETALYLAAGLRYSPRQAPFGHVNELSLVLGASPALVERALPYVTVYSKSADIDALVAPPQVIAALPGMTPQLLNDFLKQRPTLPHDPKAVAAALGAAKGAASPETQAFRVLTALRFDNGRHTSTEAVILLAGGSKVGTTGQNQNQPQPQTQNQPQNQPQNQNQNQNQNATKDDGKEPYSILSWQDQVETEAGSHQLKRAGR